MDIDMVTQNNINETTATLLRGSETLSDNTKNSTFVILNTFVSLSINSVKNLFFFIGYKNEILRFRLRMTIAGQPVKGKIKNTLLALFVLPMLFIPINAHAVPIGTLSVGQKTGDFSLGFGIDYKMRRVNYDGYDTDMATKGFSAAARYSIISSLTVFADAGFADVSLSNPNFQGYMGFSYGGGLKFSVPDPHRSRYTINFDADVYNVQSGNSVRNANDFEYSGAIYAAFKNANTITYGGLQASNVDLSFTSPNQDYHSKYNVGALFGMDEFITPFLFFNFEVHVFDEQSVEGSMGYEFF